MEPVAQNKVFLMLTAIFNRRAMDLAPPVAGPAYADFQSLKYHSWGMVLEKNWGDRAKLALESNFDCSNQVGNGPGVKTVNPGGNELSADLPFVSAGRGLLFSTVCCRGGTILPGAQRLRGAVIPILKLNQINAADI